MSRRELLNQVEELARKAGDLIRTKEPGRVEYKGAVDLVTEVDRLAESLLVEGLRRCLPEAGILAEEESGDAGETSSLLWVIDPLDGTTNFAHGYPAFAVSIALVEARRPVLGVVYDPFRRELFRALEGEGAELNGERIHVAEDKRLDRALVATGFPYDIRSSDRDNLLQFNTFAKLVQGLRRGGSAALDLSYVAVGRLDGFWEEKLAPWDVAAGILLVQEAGGIVSGYLGHPCDAWEGHIVAGPASVHREMVRILSEIESHSGLGLPRSRPF